MKNPQVYIGADHRGFALKKALKKYLDAKKIPYSDLGNNVYDKKDDYPDYAFKVAEKVSTHGSSRGILICGSAEGVSIAANKVRGIRATPVLSVDDAKLVRQHNDANILCLSAWNLSLPEAKKIAETFLKTKASSQPRHRRRINKIVAYEKKHLR